jgi:Ca2+-binding EF-hand superfamily protein
MRFPHIFIRFTVTLCALFIASSAPAQVIEGTASGVGDRVWEILLLHDDDSDGIITRAEFDRDSRAFSDYDLNQDGRLNRAEIVRWASSRSRARPGRGAAGSPPAGSQRGGAARNRGRGPTRMISALGDLDADGIVTEGEWNRVLDGMSAEGVIPVDTLRTLLAEKGMARMTPFIISRWDPDGAGFIDRWSLGEMFRRVDADGDGRIEVPPTEGLARPASPRDGADRSRGEARLFRGGAAPVVGDRAPDFTLSRSDDPQVQVQLSSFTGKKPVALIFGSYT